MHMNLYNLAVALAMLATAAEAHMIMKTPKPFGGPELDNSPLTSSNFPCKIKGDPATFYNSDGLDNTMAVGETQTLSFTGSAVQSSPITVTGSGSKRSEANETLAVASRDELPELFVANLADINSCKTSPSTDLEFPNPGPNVERPGTNSNFAKVEGTNCVPRGATDSGSGSGGSADSGSGGSDNGNSNGGSPTTSSAAPPTSPLGFATSFIDSPSSSAPAATVSSPAPSSTSAAADSNPTGGSSSGSAGALSGPCDSEGMFNCDSTSYQQCASGAWTAMQPLPAGTVCAQGQSTTLWARDNMNAPGRRNKPPWTVRAKATYGNLDFERAKRAVGLPEVSVPGNLMVLGRTQIPLRALHYVRDHFPAEAYLATFHYLFHAFWALRLDLTSAEALEKALGEIPSGFAGKGTGDAARPLFASAQVGEVMRAVGSQTYKDALKKATDEALRRGAFGCPWLWVTNAEGKAEPFFGSDRWHYIYEFLGLPYQDVALLPPRKPEVADSKL
ncbi:hypothetical protein DL764_010826 [Monosporascus ibericus]|uniref:DSBA-like thioredoxin domain-containing protein n=1 Tax=Monosporascus ibericus TaxID=155417 RepID=A0A4V1X8L0_9PEZI|nr:hypothetical protein DL764_010826 [Monosporascus ibericus]